MAFVSQANFATVYREGRFSTELFALIGLQASNLGVGALSRALGLSVGTVSKYLRAVRRCGISAAEAETLPEHGLEQRVSARWRRQSRPRPCHRTAH